MRTNSNAAGLAALSICESLLLSLTDLEIIERGEGLAAAVMAPSLFGVCGAPWECGAS